MADYDFEHWMQRFQELAGTEERCKWLRQLIHWPPGKVRVADLRHELVTSETVNADVLALASLVIQHLLDRPSEEKRLSLQDWFWDHLRGANGAPNAQLPDALVVCLWSPDHSTDYPAIGQLERFMCHHDFPNARFGYVRPGGAGWEYLHFSRYKRVLCIGRMSLYPEKWFAGLPPLALSMPPLPENVHERPPLAEQPGAGDVHRVDELSEAGTQSHFCSEYRMTEGDDGKSEREDFAIVQCCRSRDRWYSSLAGTSSLGTAGAIKWLTHAALYTDDCPAGLRDDSTLEVLLNVRGVVHTPLRPWEPSVEVVNVYVDGQPTRLDKEIEVVSVTESRDGKAQAVAFDGVSAKLSPNRSGLLLAMLRYLDDLNEDNTGSPIRIVPLCQLFSTKHVWRGYEELRENFQRLSQGNPKSLAPLLARRTRDWLKTPYFGRKMRVYTSSNELAAKLADGGAGSAASVPAVMIEFDWSIQRA